MSLWWWGWKLYSSDRAKRFAVFQQPLDAGVAQAYLDRTAGMLAPTPEGLDGPGPNIMMDAYAAQARLHMATYGTTQRQIAAVASKNHGHSRFNPLSQYRDAMSVDEIMAAPTVAWPLTVPMCAPISDGGSAAIVCSAEMLARFPDARPVRVLAAEQQSGSDRAPDAYDRHVTRITAMRAFEKAGVGPGDMDLAEVHDASSSGEITQVEALGLCGPGLGGVDAERGDTALGGRIPVNVSGGLVSRGIRWAPLASARFTNWSRNCAARRARGRWRVRGWRSRRIAAALRGRGRAVGGDDIGADVRRGAL